MPARRSPLLLAPALVLGLSFSAACGDDAPRGGGPDGPDGSSGGSSGIPGDGGPFDGAATPACIQATGDGDPLPGVVLDDIGRGTATATGEGCRRSFSIESTAPRRDDDPKSPRVVEEREGRPSLQTRNVLFDSLYQLAWTEAEQLSVSEIKDGAFQNGQGLTCPEGCFETGAKWTYVWTRDTGYAADLGLAWLDPSRARASLEMKLSTRRDGEDLQLVQDTGTGGSYPVSSDRVVWSIGAGAVLAQLAGQERDAFRDRALEAMVNTIDHDRVVVFDAADGLYRGEQSFLDWRAQSYPGWTVPDTAHIAMSKSLSTNMAHFATLALASELAGEKGDTATQKRIAGYRDALRDRIRSRFWLPEERQFSTYVTTALDQAPARRFDLLGTSLAILFDVATPEQAKDAIATYPTLAKGPPVLFPQQKETAIYHNRAIWPFVTAYWVKAAKKAGNARAVDSGLASLVRGAALNLSNMENLELVTGKPWHDDGAFSGPVVNSQRQLWSVAGYVGAMHAVLFGLEPTQRGLRVAPLLPRVMREKTFAASRTLVLNNVRVRGKSVSVVLNLPDAKAGAPGAYSVHEVRLNGTAVKDGFIDDAALAPRNLVEVDLVDPPTTTDELRFIANPTDYRSIFGPRTPSVDALAVEGGKLAVSIGIAGEAAADVTLDIYRDGVRVAKDLPGSTTKWTDQATSGASSPSHCYTVESRYTTSKNTSQRAQPACYWGAGNARIQSVSGASFEAVGGETRTDGIRTYRGDWGDPGHTLAATFTAASSGAHLIEVVYANGAGSIETGITCGLKKVDVLEQPAGTPVATGYVVMPHRGSWTSWGSSSFVSATLSAGKSYKVVLRDDSRSVNMSAFDHFKAYTGGTGGSSGPFFRVDVSEIKLLSLAP